MPRVAYSFARTEAAEQGNRNYWDGLDLTGSNQKDLHAPSSTQDALTRACSAWVCTLGQFRHARLTQAEAATCECTSSVADRRRPE